MEQITIPSPENGIWKLSVKSNALPYGQKQLFSVTMSCLGVTQYSAAKEVSLIDTLDHTEEPLTFSPPEEPLEDEETEDEETEDKPERDWRSHLASLWTHFANFLRL